MAKEINLKIDYCFYKGGEEKRSYPPFNEGGEEWYLLYREKRSSLGQLLTHELMCALTGTQSNKFIRVKEKKDQLLVGEWSK